MGWSVKYRLHACRYSLRACRWNPPLACSSCELSYCDNRIAYQLRLRSQLLYYSNATAPGLMKQALICRLLPQCYGNATAASITVLAPRFYSSCFSTTVITSLMTEGDGNYTESEAITPTNATTCNHVSGVPLFQY